MADEKNEGSDAASVTANSTENGGFASTAETLCERLGFELNDEYVVKMLARGKSAERCQFKREVRNACKNLNVHSLKDRDGVQRVADFLFELFNNLIPHGTLQRETKDHLKNIRDMLQKQLKKSAMGSFPKTKYLNDQQTDHNSEGDDAADDDSRSATSDDDCASAAATAAPPDEEAVVDEEPGRPRRAKKRPMFDYEDIVHTSTPKPPTAAGGAAAASKKSPLKALKVEAEPVEDAGDAAVAEVTAEVAAPLPRPNSAHSIDMVAPTGAALLPCNDIIHQELLSRHNVKVLIGKPRSIADAAPRRPKVNRSTQIAASCGACAERSSRQRTRASQTDAVQFVEDNKTAVLITRPTFKDFMTFIDNMMKLYERVAFDQGTDPVQVVLKPGAALAKQKGSGDSSKKNTSNSSS